MLKIKIQYIFATTFIFASQPLLAQERIPTFPQQPPSVSPLTPEEEIKLVPLSPPPSPPEITGENIQAIKVKRFVFEGNTVFSNQRLEELLAPFIGKEITFSNLLLARAEITKLYVDNGYISSGAYLPITENQAIDPNQAVITIGVVEGKLDKINVVGTSSLEHYIRSRLPNTSTVLNSDRLLEDLQLLQQDPLISSITAELIEGTRLQRPVLTVTVKEREPFKVEAILDNSRSPAVGSFQRRVELTHANLLGLGDRFIVGYRNTEGSNTITTSYTVPINPQNGTLQFFYANTSSTIIERPFTNLDILSDARAYEVTFRQPLLQRATANSNQEFALALTASRLESESSLLNTPFPLSIGADATGRTRISAVRFSQEWIDRSRQQVLYVRSQFSLGIDAFNATINDSDPDSRFFAWRGQATWVRRLSANTLQIRADMQLADRPLLPLEQIGLGGANSVRGYRQDTFLTDNRLLLSAEFYIPVWQEETGILQLIPFLDLGTAWNHSNGTNNTSVTTGTLGSFGLGLQYQLGNRFNARLDLGIPLFSVNTNSDAKTWQENGIYFSLGYQL
ncbi:BamA/TamA family outer membrane protein [Nodularia spumigena CS-584]|uniref:ShlB/FhaC/HecB family hemolysin secretion/activation protein n=1 Tax=Nodularia spumigena TaxID=70799 RepID=UPI0000EA928A|nr:ShlB/FhaC/HecB family hemolysin secretion/activation protein [Nodularia spumigena]AHJ28603.1 Hemolysin activation/secretion protein [Nodularia spumigena CCY9414]EAW43014.1 Surface antigen variable number protein [Nodularia spumigena CCY9414]MDB9382820.1 BamA/TamA family outer membrane protein [Nodularia spumigena CS-584]